MYTRKQKNKQKRRTNRKKGEIKGGSTELLEFMATFGIKIKDFFSGDLAKGFLSIFAGVGQGLLFGFEQLWKFMLYIWKEFGKGLNSPCVRIILIIFGILASFSVVGWGLTATGVANVFGTGGIVTGWLSTVASINIFNIIGSIFTILWSTVTFLGENLLVFLFTGPTVIVTLTWSIILAGVSGMVLAFISNSLENLEIIKEYKKTKDVNKALTNIQGRKKPTNVTNDVINHAIDIKSETNETVTNVTTNDNIINKSIEDIKLSAIEKVRLAMEKAKTKGEDINDEAIKAASKLAKVYIQSLNPKPNVAAQAEYEAQRILGVLDNELIEDNSSTKIADVANNYTTKAFAAANKVYDKSLEAWSLFKHNNRWDDIKEGWNNKKEGNDNKKGGKISLRDKMSKLSAKKMLAIFNSIPKATMDKVREENPAQFFIAILIGFIKETETGYEFTEQGIKTLKSIINSSMNIIDKHCPKGESCKPSKSRKERVNLSFETNKENRQKKNNKTQKNTEELSYDDALEIKDLLTSLEFVHMSSIHAVIRENEDNTKTYRDSEISGGARKKLNTKKTLNHLKKEDVEWLKKKHPEKFESAKRMGFVNDEFEMTDISAKVLEESDNVNGISISRTYAEPIRSQ